MEDAKSRFKRICVFCGSSSGKKATYQEAAVELGKELVMEFSKFFLSICISCPFSESEVLKDNLKYFSILFLGSTNPALFHSMVQFWLQKNSFFFFSSLFPCPSLKGIFFMHCLCSGIKQFRNLVVSLSFERGHMIVLLIK